MPDQDTGLRIPKSLRSEIEEIFALIDGFGAEKLDDEYAELCRRLGPGWRASTPPRWPVATCVYGLLLPSTSWASRTSSSTAHRCPI